MVRIEQLPENAANVELLIGAMNKSNSSGRSHAGMEAALQEGQVGELIGENWMAMGEVFFLGIAPCTMATHASQR
jgi:hypothetical protein